jgi:hypothetical protein
MSHVYCSECGFQNPETANYCSRCGALLEKGEAGTETQSFTPDEVGELASEPVEGLEGPAKGPYKRLPVLAIIINPLPPPVFGLEQ